MPSYHRAAEPARVVLEHGTATAVFVLGVLSVVGLPVFGPVAWVLGRRVLREIDASVDGVYRNRGLARVGMVLGIIGTALLVLIVVGVTTAVVVLVGVSRTT